LLFFPSHEFLNKISNFNLINSYKIDPCCVCMFFATRYIHCEDSSCSEAPVPLVQLQHINGQIIMMPKQANTDTTTVSWEFFLCFDISFLFVCFVFFNIVNIWNQYFVSRLFICSTEQRISWRYRYSHHNGLLKHYRQFLKLILKKLYKIFI